jgi:parallel beta-helix repeat protein
MREQTRRAIITLALFISLAVGWKAAVAATLFVSPSGSNSNNCLSQASPCLTIQAAVNKSANGDTINVAAGTYAEEVLIVKREDLNITATPGAQLILPATPEGVFVNISRSHGINLRGLRITGDVDGDELGILITESTVSIIGCTIENLGGGGILAGSYSDVLIGGGVIQGNQQHGIRVDAFSAVTLSGQTQQGAPVIKNNPFAGVIVNGDGQLGLRSSVIIENNGYGILAEGGNVSSCCNEGEHQILNNEIGVFMRGGHLELRGPALVKGNTSGGIQLVGTSGSFSRFGKQVNRVVVRENNEFGILLIGSHLDIIRSDVVFNNGKGILLRDTSSARLFNLRVSDNRDAGTRLEGLSSVQLIGNVLMENNAGFDFSCTPNSNAWGDRSGVRRMFCPGFDHSPDPAAGRPGNP